MKTAKSLAASGLLLATAGCLHPPGPPASYGYVSDPYQAQPVAPFVGQSPPTVYQPPPYQPPPLSPALTPQTVPLPSVGSPVGGDRVRYLPAPQPPQSLLGPPRADWKPGGGF